MFTFIIDLILVLLTNCNSNRRGKGTRDRGSRSQERKSSEWKGKWDEDLGNEKERDGLVGWEEIKWGS